VKIRRVPKLVALGFACFSLAFSGTTSPSSADALHPEQLEFFCETSNDNSCIESVEYFNKDHPELGFVDLGIPTSGINGSALFETTGTTFTTNNGSTGVPVRAWASIYDIQTPNGDVGFAAYATPDAVGAIGGPTNISTTSYIGVRFGIMVGRDNGLGSEESGGDKKRIGDKFRMKLRISTMPTPVAFETQTSNFKFQVDRVGNNNVLTAEGEVAESFNIRSGNYPCGPVSIASATLHTWETYAFSAKFKNANAIQAGYKVRVMSECRPIMPSFDSAGAIKFGASAPHFRPDGVTPVVGALEIQLPMQSWPILAATSSQNVSVSYGSSDTPVPASVTIENGEARYLIPNIHFSEPTITIGSKLSGVKGKKVNTKTFLKSTGVRAPKGSIVKISSTSKKVCKVSKSKINYLKNGTCKIKVVVQKSKKNKTLIVNQVFTISVRKR
jgi:hypothetical protein